MTYRTKTYIAADWSGDIKAIEKLYEWNENYKLSLSFTDAHEVTQARDESLNCSIKKSLSTRLDVSKTFILIVGADTKKLRNGSCQYCTDSYNGLLKKCNRDYSIDYQSYIEYECAKAIKDGLKIVVLYNSTLVNKSNCPDLINSTGKHVPMKIVKEGTPYWNYKAVKDAIIS